MPARYGLNGITNPTPFLYPPAEFLNTPEAPRPCSRSGAFGCVQAPGQARNTVRNSEAPRPLNRGAFALEFPPTTSKTRGNTTDHVTKR